MPNHLLWSVQLCPCSHKQMHCTNAFCMLSVHEIGYQTGLIHQRFKDMCATWQHVTIIIDTANEHAQFCGIVRSIHVEYGIDLLFLRYTPCGVSHYPSQSISLTAYSRLSGLVVKPFLRSQHKMVANSLTWWFQSVEKAPASSYIWLHNIIWIHVIWIFIMWTHA